MSIRPVSPIFSQAEIDEVSDILQKAEEAELQEEMNRGIQKSQEVVSRATQEGAFGPQIGKRERSPELVSRKVRPKILQEEPIGFALPQFLKPFNGYLHRDIERQLGFPEPARPPSQLLTNVNIHRLDQEFVDLHNNWSTFISAIFIRKNQGLPFTPFDIEIGPDDSDMDPSKGFPKKIIDMQFLSNVGVFFKVYLCTDIEGGKWVLKLYKRQNLNQLVNIIAAQFLRYATFMHDEELRPHMITHWNFQGHLNKVNDFLKMESKKERFEKFKKYVQEMIGVPFLFCPYIEGGHFPLEFNQDSVHWKNLKNLFDRLKEIGLGNDLRRSGVRIVQEKLLMIDIDGCDELDSPAITREENLSSFSPDPKAQNWIYPQ